ncbi:PfkB family carbohydrate kinase, partial [Escherichia coli]|uniref:PfkB family carbohydrate kinase n=1 Tax=Escherichia coli TaxID=562 RepID=UPI00201AFB12
YYAEGLPTERGKYVARIYTEVGGGPAATAAVPAARLVAQVVFIGRVGDYDTGHSLLSELEFCGVNTRYTKPYNQAKSSQSPLLLAATAHRLIITYPTPD